MNTKTALILGGSILLATILFIAAAVFGYRALTSNIGGGTSDTPFFDGSAIPVENTELPTVGPTPAPTPTVAPTATATVQAVR